MLLFFVFKVYLTAISLKCVTDDYRYVPSKSETRSQFSNAEIIVDQISSRYQENSPGDCYCNNR